MRAHLISTILGATLLLGCSAEEGPAGDGDCASCDEAVMTFDWGEPGDCPDLSPAGREAAVIVEGIHEDGLFPDEQFIFDCGDGGSGAIEVPAGFWHFEMDVVDQYSDLDERGPFDCFDSDLNGDDCLYYTDQSRVVGLDTDTSFIEGVDVDFDYAFARFDFEYQIDGLEPDSAQCAGFGSAGAMDFAVTMTLVDHNDGILEDVFVCGTSPVLTRDLPLGSYAPVFDLLDENGEAINENPVVPTEAVCPDGICTLEIPFENFQLDTIRMNE